MRAEDADQFLATLIGGSEDALPPLTAVCRNATGPLHMSGASVVLMGDDTFPSVAGAYGVSVTVPDLEFTLGEGPASDAYAEGKPVLVDDMASSLTAGPSSPVRSLTREFGACMHSPCRWERSSWACSSSTATRPAS